MHFPGIICLASQAFKLHHGSRLFLYLYEDAESARDSCHDLPGHVSIRDPGIVDSVAE